MQKGRLCVTLPRIDSNEAIKILQDAGVEFVTVPVSDLAEPELTIGSEHFWGLDQIKNLASDFQLQKGV